VLPVMILCGGLSFEREVSLSSGRRACQALKGEGIDAITIDTDHHLLLRLEREPPSAVINLLHGQRGEDGAMSEVLEMASVPYVGPQPHAARLAFDKPTAKELVRRAGLQTPNFCVLPLGTFQELGADGITNALAAKFGLPLVVKPACGGSALGVTIVRERRDLPAAMVQCFAYSDTALIEQYVEGTEIAITIIEEAADIIALPVVEISYRTNRCDYEARYTAGQVDFTVPSNLPTAIQVRATDAAIAIHQELRLRDLSRVDMIVDALGTPNFLEVTCCPGLTETSVVPIAIEASGRTLGGILTKIVVRAMDRFSAPKHVLAHE